MSNFESIIGSIYEAAVLPELWPSVLDALAARIGCVGGELFTSDLRQVFKWTTSEATRQFMFDFVAGGWPGRNPRLDRTVALKHAGFVVDHDVFTPEEIETEPSYVEFFRPHGFGWGAGTAIVVPSGDFAAFSFERLLENGPVSAEDVAAVDRVRPHLARAAVLSARLQMEQARAMAQTLAMIGLPAAVLARGGRLLAANSLLEGMRLQVRFLSQDRIAFVDETAQSLFTAALAGLESGSDKPVRSMPLREKDNSPPCVAHLLPIKGAAHDIFSRAESLLIVTPLTASRMNDASILSGLFDLTAAESRVARGLVEGRTLNQIAGCEGLSVQTLRSQLKTVFNKTGTHRQAELITLLGKAAAVGGR